MLKAFFYLRVCVFTLVICVLLRTVVQHFGVDCYIIFRWGDEKATSYKITIRRVVLGVLSCVLLRYVMLPLVLSFLLCCAVVCSVAFCCAVWVRLRTVRKDLFEFLFIV